MNDKADNEEIERPPVATPEGPLAGERLATARREQQITVLEIAKELHLDEPKVRALEKNEFEVLGAPVFAKGHLRKYAALVGVNIDDVLADYYTLNRSAGMPPVVGKVRRQTREVSPGPWIAVIILVIVAATAYWWFFERESSEAASAPVIAPPAGSLDDSDLTPDSAVAVPMEMPQADIVTTAPPFEETTPAAGDAAVSDDSAATTVAVADEPLSAGDVQLTLTFTGDCWTEVSDASGRRLFFDMGRDGVSRTITGQAPLAVLFGNADAVTVAVNGVNRAITAADRRGETARMTIFVP